MPERKQSLEMTNQSIATTRIKQALLYLSVLFCVLICTNISPSAEVNHEPLTQLSQEALIRQHIEWYSEAVNCGQPTKVVMPRPVVCNYLSFCKPALVFQCAVIERTADSFARALSLLCHGIKM